MDIKLELLANSICDAVRENMGTLNINPEEITDSQATKILGKIKAVICDESLDDFEAIDKIVDIFTEYNIDINGRHDF